MSLIRAAEMVSAAPSEYRIFQAIDFIEMQKSCNL